MMTSLIAVVLSVVQAVHSVEVADPPASLAVEIWEAIAKEGMVSHELNEGVLEKDPVPVAPNREWIPLRVDCSRVLSAGNVLRIPRDVDKIRTSEMPSAAIVHEDWTFIWFGSYGRKSLYDHHEFRTFVSEPVVIDTLMSHGITEDNANRMVEEAWARIKHLSDEALLRAVVTSPELLKRNSMASAEEQIYAALLTGCRMVYPDPWPIGKVTWFQRDNMRVYLIPSQMTRWRIDSHDPILFYHIYAFDAKEAVLWSGFFAYRKYTENLQEAVRVAQEIIDNRVDE